MPPKKKGGGKKKKDDGGEPPHDPAWERVSARCTLQGRASSMECLPCTPHHCYTLLCVQTVETGVWERSCVDLPGKGDACSAMRAHLCCFTS